MNSMFVHNWVHDSNIANRSLKLSSLTCCTYHVNFWCLFQSCMFHLCYNVLPFCRWCIAGESPHLTLWTNVSHITTISKVNCNSRWKGHLAGSVWSRIDHILEVQLLLVCTELMGDKPSTNRRGQYAQFWLVRSSTCVIWSGTCTIITI